jgi:hypothetical protein
MFCFIKDLSYIALNIRQKKDLNIIIIIVSYAY